MSNTNGTPNTAGCLLTVLLMLVCLNDLEENPMSTLKQAMSSSP